MKNNQRLKTVAMALLAALFVGATGCDVIEAGADLTGANLAGRNLSDKNLNSINLSNANLTDANLFGANLSEAIMRGADLSGADLRRADLREADFAGAMVEGANLGSTKLVGARMQGTDWGGVNLEYADLSRVDLSGVTMVGANLTGANLQDANLTGAILSGATLDGADLAGANLKNAVLVDVGFSEARLQGANIAGADLSGSDLSESDVFQDQSLLALALGQGAIVGDLAMQEFYRSVCADNAPIPGAGTPGSSSAKDEFIVVQWDSGRPLEEQDWDGRLGDRRYVVCVSSEEDVVYRTCTYIGMGDIDISRADVMVKIVDASSGIAIAHERLRGPEPRWSDCPHTVCSGFGDCGNFPRAGELHGDSPDYEDTVGLVSRYLDDGDAVGASWPALFSDSFADASVWQVTPPDGVQVNAEVTDSGTYRWDIDANSAGVVTGASNSLISAVPNEFSVSVLVKRVGGTGRSRPGLYYGYRPEENKAYTFFVESDSRYSVWLQAGDIFTEIRPSSSHSAISDDGANILGVTVIAEQHQFYINGQLVDTIEVKDYEPGTIGLVAEVSEGASAAFEWDNLELRRPGLSLEELLQVTRRWDSSWLYYSPLGMWQVEETDSWEDAKVELTRGEESIELEVAADAQYAVIGLHDIVEEELRDFYASVMVTPDRVDDESAAGIRFRASGDYRYYLFAVWSDGYIGTGQQAGDEFRYNFSTPYLSYEPGRTWEMSVLAIGPEFHFLVNGDYAGYLWDETLSEGFVSLQVGTPANSTAKYVLDKLVVRAPELP